MEYDDDAKKIEGNWLLWEVSGIGFGWLYIPTIECTEDGVLENFSLLLA